MACPRHSASHLEESELEPRQILTQATLNNFASYPSELLWGYLGFSRPLDLSGISLRF